MDTYNTGCSTKSSRYNTVSDEQFMLSRIKLLSNPHIYCQKQGYFNIANNRINIIKYNIECRLPENKSLYAIIKLLFIQNLRVFVFQYLYKINILLLRGRNTGISFAISI